MDRRMVINQLKLRIGNIGTLAPANGRGCDPRSMFPIGVFKGAL